MKTVGQEAAEKILHECLSAQEWVLMEDVDFNTEKAASIIDKIIEERSANATTPNTLGDTQLRGQAELKPWRRDDDYIYEDNAEQCGKFIGRAHDDQDADSILSAHNAALPVHKKGDSANQVVENLRGAGYDVVLESETPDSVGDKESNETGVVTEVLEERARQDRKWGEQNHDPFEQALREKRKRIYE